MNLQESIRRILREETDSVKNLNESKTSQHLKLMNNLLDPFKEKDCICDIRITFDVEENYYDVYLVFGQEELHEKFFDLVGIRTYIQKMMNEVKVELESFLPIRNVFIGYYTTPNCEWSPLNESENKKSGLLRAIEEDGLYEVITSTSLHIHEIEQKVGQLSREILERFIKDYIHEDGYHQTDGAVQMPYEVEISHNIYVNHFYMKGDKVTVEIRGYNDYNEHTDGYIESLSNLTDEEIFSIVDDMTRNIEDNWD